MKKLFLLILPAVLLFACEQSTTSVETETVSQTVTFSGKIENPKNNKVTLKGANDFEEQSTLKEDGTFSMSFDIEKAGMYSLRHGGERSSFYLEPNYNTAVNLNTEEFDETLKYTGDGALENNYLVAYYLKNEELFSDSKAVFSLDAVAFKEKMKDIYSQLHVQHEEYVKAHQDIQKDFAMKRKTDLKYEQYSNQLNYVSYHNYYTKEEIDVEENFYDFLDDAELQNEELMASSNYKSFLKNYIDVRLVQKEMEKEPTLKDLPNGKTTAEFKVIEQNFKNETIKNYLLSKSMNGAISYGSLDNIEDLITKYNQLSSSQEDQEEVKVNFEKWSALVKGQPAPNFSGVKTDGQKVSLEDLRNKYVYVDVWATWCGPCKREWPHLENIETAYRDNNNIAFVSISIDENKEAWEKMVTEKNMKGIQIFTENAWKSTITQDYIIKGIPRFLLIDKEGKILDARAARPSSDEIKEQLTELVGEGNYQMMSMK